MLEFISGWWWYALLVLFVSLAQNYSDKRGLIVLSQISSQYLMDIKTIPNFLIAFLIFEAVIQMKERKSSLISKLATPVFSVYIFHQVPAFYPILWRIILRCELYGIVPNVVFSILVELAIFAVVFAVDILRRGIVEPRLLACKPMKKIINYIDYMINACE